MALITRNNSKTGKYSGFSKEMRDHGWTWHSSGALLGMGGGLGAAILGSILTAITWFSGPNWKGLALQTDGTLLLFVTIPLLILGAHCLDLLERQR